MNVQEETAAAATDVSTPKEIFTAHVRKVSSCRTTKEYVVVALIHPAFLAARNQVPSQVEFLFSSSPLEFIP